MNVRNLLMATATALLPMAVPLHAATLLGDEISIAQFFPTLNTAFGAPEIITVDNTDLDRSTFGGGVFAHADDLTLNIISPNATRFATSFSSAADPGNFVSFQGLDFSDGSVLTGISLSSTFGGITAGDLLFGDDFVTVNLSGIPTVAGDSLVIDLITSSSADDDPIDPDISAVPVPAGGILLLTGLAGLAAARRRKKNDA